MKPTLNRRDVFRVAFASAVGAFAGKASMGFECLPPPDCATVCGGHGGVPKGDGTNACVCYDRETPTYAVFGNTFEYRDLINTPVLSKVATSGKYSDLRDRPLRALSEIDGGSAINAKKWNGKSWNLQSDTGENMLPVLGDGAIDYLMKSECVPSLPTVSTTSFSSTKGAYSINVTTDSQGRLNGISVGNTNCNCHCNCNCCNCNCCNCGDDSAY